MSTLFLSLKSLPLSRASLSFSGCRRGLCKAVLGLFILIFAGAVLPAACITDASNPGCAHLALRTSSSFDVYTNHPGTYGPWLNEHLWRMQTSTPYFNRKLSWFRNAWAYIDSYAIYRGSALLTQHPEWLLRDQRGECALHPMGMFKRHMSAIRGRYQQPGLPQLVDTAGQGTHGNRL